MATQSVRIGWRPYVSSTPSVITNGLSLHLDAGNLTSYLGTGSTWTDLSGSNNNGTLNGQMVYSTLNGGSLLLDGVNDYVDFGNNTLLYNAYNNSFTQEFWVNMNLDSTLRTILRVDDWSRIWLQMSSTQIQFKIGYDNVQSDTISYNGTFDYNQWYNITVVWSKLSQQKIYVNGVLVAERTPLLSSYPGINGTEGGANLGRGHSTPYSNYSIGKISIFRHYNRVLTSAEILQNYNATKTRFLNISLLDNYTNALAAYSFRKLSTTYSGPCIRVRRSGDNTEMDISFNSSNVLDETALMNFVGVYNQLTYSQDFTNAAYVKSGITITADQGVAPDGTMTADLYSESATTGSHYLYRYYPNRTLPSGYNWNASFYIKKAPDNTATNNKIIAKENLATGPAYAEFNLDNGSTYIYNLNTLNITGATMSNEGNGWWRCSISGDIPAGKTLYTFPINIFRNGSNNVSYSFAGDAGAKYYIWGMQVTGVLNNVSGKLLLPYTKTTVGVGGDGFITTWYDQSGSGRNATQPTAASQPYVAWEGNMLKNNGKATLKKFKTGLNSYGTSISGETSFGSRVLRYPYGSFTITNPVSVFTATRYNGTGNLIAVGGDYYSTISANHLDSSINGKFSIKSGHFTGGYLNSIVDPNTNNNVKFMLFNGANSKISVNDGVVTSGSINALDLRGISIGGGSTTPYILNDFDGDIQEVILWNSDQSNNRLNILNNINTYYQCY
jgi:hypothetical protein